MRQAVSVPPATVDPRLGPVLARLRSERGLSQQQLSSRSDLTTGTLNKIELSRSSPTWPTLVAIAKSLEISLRDLAGLIEDEGDF